MKKRVNCANAGCNYCSKAICVGENFFGDKLYRCSALKRKHKKIRAKECGEFLCNNYNSMIWCNDCRRGN